MEPIIKKMSQVTCKAVEEFKLASGEIITPPKGKGFLQVTIKNPPQIYGVFYHGEKLKDYIPEATVFFGYGYGHFGIEFPLKKQAAEVASRNFYTFAEKNWVNQEVDT